MEKWTIKKLLEWSTEYFQEKKFESPRLESEILLSHVLGIRRLDLYLQFDRPMDPNDLTEYKALIKRRLDSEPVAYIVGKKEFWSRDFYVNAKSLIPRPDTETLIQVILDEKDRWTERLGRAPLNGYEIGVGTGIIGVTLLSEIADLKLTGLELDIDVVDLAKKNASYHGVQDRFDILAGDVFQFNFGTDKVDLMVSNPPYIRSADIANLEQTVKDYEPHSALDGGEDGLKFYKFIALKAYELLNDGGLLAVEIGEDQGEDVVKIFADKGFQDVKIQQDFGQRNRVVYCYR